MTSRAFKARTSHTDERPQLCGLTGNPIMEGDWCLYLVCHGADARPDWQVLNLGQESVTGRGGKSYKKNVYESARTGQPFFSVWTGEWETYQDADGKTKRRRVYEWQVEDAQGRRYPIEVWSNMVHVRAAEALGYRIPKDEKGKLRKTTAFKGDRTKGHEHRVSQDAEAPLVTLAKAALDDEEAGLVPPPEESEDPDKEAAAERILMLLDNDPPPRAQHSRDEVPF